MAALVKSTVQRGTEFEKKSLSLLEKYLSMSLRRVGGKADGGIDLQGWWWLPPLSLPSRILNTPKSPSLLGEVQGDLPERSRVRVLAQCKATKKKMGPHTVREMEGVLYQYSSNRLFVRPEDPINSPKDISASPSELTVSPHGPVVALLISQSPFTRATILRAASSTVPFFLLHLPENFQSADNTTTEPHAEPGIGAAVWNKALYGADGLLGNQLEVRWERNLDGGGAPGLWYNGKPMKNWVPPSLLSSQELYDRET